MIGHWDEISDRAGEIVPDYGFTQAERELASVEMAASAMVVQR